MKLAFFETEAWMEAVIRERFANHEVVIDSNPLTETTAERYSDAEVISVFVYSKLGKSTLDRLSHVRLISTRSTGFDHIDIALAKERDVLVTNVPRYGSITVAEHTFALILALSRNIYASSERTEHNDFSITGLRGFDLHGKTLGLVGLGEIGKQVARMSQAFSMKLRIFNRSRDYEFISQFDEAVFVDQVEDIFTHSDVISFHIPLTSETYHLLNLDNYHFIKKGAVIINTSRGSLIDTRALIKGIQEGLIRGAGLDVLESESVIKNQVGIDPNHLPKESEITETFLNHILLEMPNVVITPHNAFNSDESIQRLLESELQNIEYFLNDRTDLMSLIEI